MKKPQLIENQYDEVFICTGGESTNNKNNYLNKKP
jgi:hypothetical protein